MPLSREQKSDLVADYAEGLAQAPHVFLVGFEGITVPQVTELRDRVRKSGGRYVVVKNRLALRAIEGHELAGLEGQFEGATAAAFSTDDAVGVAKALTEFAKEVPAIQLKGGLVDGQEVAPEDIKEIASLPSREELVAKLLFLLQSPITRFVRTLNELPRQFVGVLDQIARKKDDSGG
jgi:large subunit ribosomal protein L10